MSGEIGLLVLLPLALPVAAGYAAVTAAGAAGKAAVNAGRAYEEKKRQERELVRRSGIDREITGFRKSAKELMEEQRKQNKALSEEFEKEVERNREVFASQAGRILEAPEEFGKDLTASAARMTAEMDRRQKELQSTYRDAIAASLAEAERESSKKMADTMAEIQALHEDEAKRQEAQKTAAMEYIADAEDLLKSLKLDFSGEKYLGDAAVALHESALSEARRQYEKGNYEGCLIAVVSLMAKLRADILTADEKHQEFENWQKMAAVLIAENREMMASMSTLSKEFYEELEDACVEDDRTFTLRDELIGMDLTPFWGTTADGQSVYTVMLEKLNQLEKSVLGEGCVLTTAELKEIAEKMAGEWRGEIATRIRKVITRLNNALQRESLGSRIIDELVEMGYTYKDYRYLRTGADGLAEATSDDDIDAHLCMVFVDAYGDEILIELSNQNDSAVDLQITDMAEELDPEVDKSRSRREMEEAVRCIAEGSVPRRGQARITGGCKAGTEHRVVANEVNRKKKKLVAESE
ncbi:MAG: hypothetical protein LUG93_14740 [Lachnospiraceae bacterium]|nr:hypothetical protein [Lachnospiraceae bacterium]